MKDFVVYFESAQYCGEGSYAIVRAKDEKEAECIFDESGFGEVVYKSRYGYRYIKENGYHADLYCSVQWVKPLEDSGVEEYVNDPTQSQFYPRIN